MLIKPFNTIYLAEPAFLNDLVNELGDEPEVIGNLVFSQQKKSDICFAADVWVDPIVIEFNSISEAVRILRQAGKYWSLNPIENIRRSRLIESELRKLPPLAHSFPVNESLPAIGSFSLLDKNTLVYATTRWKNPPLGNFEFIEDKENPPNRAYLKLWEALALLGRYPQTAETAIDLGASPGGWSYVMQSLGAHVTAIDKSPLDPHIARLPHIHFLQQSAFALEPSSLEHTVDWLLCDVACYPDRLYDMTQKWIASGKAKQLIFTIKLQGETDLAVIQKFQAIPNSRVIHLCQNKHEATFFHPTSPALFPPFPI